MAAAAAGLSEVEKRWVGKRCQDSLFGCRRRRDGADPLVSARTASEIITAPPAKRIVTAWRLMTSTGSKRAIGAAGIDHAASSSEGGAELPLPGVEGRDRHSLAVAESGHREP